jgi:hypothetical protein
MNQLWGDFADKSAIATVYGSHQIDLLSGNEFWVVVALVKQTAGTTQATMYAGIQMGDQLAVHLGRQYVFRNLYVFGIYLFH